MEILHELLVGKNVFPQIFLVGLGGSNALHVGLHRLLRLRHCVGSVWICNLPTLYRGCPSFVTDE